MTDAPIERDQSGRFVKPEVDTRPPDREQDYHPLALTLFGWTRAPRLPLIATITVAAVLALVIMLSAGQQGVSGDLASVSGFYAGAALLSALILAVAGIVIVTLLGRDADYYGEEDTQPDDVEERL